MKASIVGLALAATVVMPAVQATPVVEFNFNGTGADGRTVPYYVENVDTNFVESGTRTNVVNGTRDDVMVYNGYRYVTHYATSTYDVTGHYSDLYIFNGSAGGPEDGVKYAYISGTVRFDPSKAENIGVSSTLNASILFSGTFTPVFDENNPGVPQFPDAPILSAGIGNDRANLSELNNSGDSPFYADRFAITGSTSFTIAPGDNDIQFLLYAGANLHPSWALLYVHGPAYNLGTYRRTEQTYLGYEVLPVPEPSSWAMLLAGAAILGIARRRKNAA